MLDLKITMLGPSGVGKTSLLTVMIDQFTTTLGNTNLQIKPDLESEAIFIDCLLKLKDLVKKDNFLAKGGIQGTEAPRSFFFELGTAARNPSLNLHFQDYPGGWIQPKADREEKKTVQRFLNESDAVLIAIDTPALMEPYQENRWKGKWNDKINSPGTIKNLFLGAYKNLSEEKLVILAPVKCEKYMQDEFSKEALVNRIKSEYKTLLDFFRSEALFTKVAVVITPVQTVGNVIFSHLDDGDGQPKFYFHQMGGNADYFPKDSEQPLRYLLRFLLRKYTRRGSWLSQLIRRLIRQALDLDEPFREAAGEVARGCKSTGAFAILQGQVLLNK